MSVQGIGDPRNKVYFLEDPLRGLLKFGVTVNCETRFPRIAMYERRRADEFHLRCLGWMPGGYELERSIRLRFAQFSVQGTNDWLIDAPEVREYIGQQTLSPFQFEYRYSFQADPYISIPGFIGKRSIGYLCPWPPTEEYLRKCKCGNCQSCLARVRSF